MAYAQAAIIIIEFKTNTTLLGFDVAICISFTKTFFFATLAFLLCFPLDLLRLLDLIFA